MQGKVIFVLLVTFAGIMPHNVTADILGLLKTPPIHLKKTLGNPVYEEAEINAGIKKTKGEIKSVIKLGEDRICKLKDEIESAIAGSLELVKTTQDEINGIADKENENTCQKIGICREILQVDQEKVNKYRNGYGDCRPSPSINTIHVMLEELKDLDNGIETVPDQCKEQTCGGEKYKDCCNFKIEQTLEKTKLAEKVIESIDIPCNIECVEDVTSYLTTYLEAIKEELLLCIKFVK